MTSDPGLAPGVNKNEDSNTPGEPVEDHHTKLTRNLNELLQELRVMQTGVQILTGFLLTLPFTGKFGEIDTQEQVVYLATLAASVVTTALIVSPVAFHRTLFRQGEREWIVESANHAARFGLAGLGTTMTGVVWVVFDVVVGAPTSYIAAGVTAALFIVLWGILPAVRRSRFGDED
ncbi:MAG TPA: DUF6328 family protein [Nocardioidaceae bacterium]|nr:DUF6328 family protein [Nocardioidaceae bacterium]